jgi:predicted membrane-bound dolichyl-phosphate-mannose-protein mannosyltransferase
MLVLTMLMFLLLSQAIGVLARPSNLPGYRDEEIYIACGNAYVMNLTPPILCNFEHPPLAKYIIGALHVLGISRTVFLLLYALSSTMLMLIVYKVSGSLSLALTSSTLLFFDTLFFNSHRFLLLDPIAIFFSLTSLYLALLNRARLSAIAAGAALSSKFSSAPTILATLLVIAKRNGFRKVMEFVAIATLTYALTYLGDLRLGVLAIVEHHIKMFSYMSWKHSFSPALAAIGFLKLLTKVEVWRFGGNIFIYVTNMSNAWSVYSTSIVNGLGNYIVIGVGLGSPTWYTLFPMLLIATYKALVGKDEALEILCAWGWASLLNIIAGPIDWYYSNALPALYACLVTGLKIVTDKKFNIITVLLLATSISLFTTTILGVVPYTITVLQC